MEIEFVMEDKRRLAVLNDLSVKEPLTGKHLAAKNRVPEPMMERVLETMEEKGVILSVNDGYELTELGREIVREVRRFERDSPARSSAPKTGAQVRIAPDHKRNQIDRRRIP